MNIYNNLKYITEGPAEVGQLYIYVLENYPQKNIKIGRTTNPKQRFSSLSGSNNGGNVISRVAISPMTYLYTLESAFHSKFNRNRIKGTEYFKDITFEEVVNEMNNIFESSNYKNSNENRKSFYEKFPNKIPKFTT